MGGCPSDASPPDKTPPSDPNRGAAQERVPTDTVLMYAHTQLHGMPSIAEPMKARILADPNALRVLAGLLDGTQKAAHWDRASALWWLAASAEPRFVPVLLRFATDDVAEHDVPSYMTAVTGLARHAATNASARARLEALARRGAAGPAGFAIVDALAKVNDATTRQLLKQVPRAGFTAEAQQLIVDALAGPVTPQGVAPAPCPSDRRANVPKHDRLRCSAP